MKNIKIYSWRLARKIKEFVEQFSYFEIFAEHQTMNALKLAKHGFESGFLPAFKENTQFSKKYSQHDLFNPRKFSITLQLLKVIPSLEYWVHSMNRIDVGVVNVNAVTAFNNK